MKAFVLSDIHTDSWFCYAVKPSRLKRADPAESVVDDTLDYIWTLKRFPETDAIIIAGDIANDYLTYVRTIKWLSKKYKQVYVTFGNHDVLVRGATVSNSNSQFRTSDEKVAAIKLFVSQFSNVHLLDGDVYNGVGGTMGMCDLQCEVVSWKNAKNEWPKWFDGRHWKHYISEDPTDIWNAEDKKMSNIVARKPTVVMSHFVPYEAGVNAHYLNDAGNTFFYFNANKYLNQMENDTFWCCGHVHDKKIIKWKNDNGKNITILCNPSGYPGEGIMTADKAIFENGKFKRYIEMTEWADFIIDIPEE